MTPEQFAAVLALIGIVILVSSLLSGAVERTGLPQVVIFLALGAALGPAGLGLVELTLQSPMLQVITTLGLVLVLFTDAISVDIAHARQQRRLAVLVLGPGTLIPAVLIGLAGWWLLDLHPVSAAILGAALASTDPVILRTLLRRPNLPAQSKLALRLESGMNDVVLLPIVVLGMIALGSGETAEAMSVSQHLVGLFLLGPLLGALAGYVAITLLEQVRRRVGVRRDYESLYALGVAFTAYAAAEAVGGSGFLAAFAAGLMIAALDVELCDCFLDYGQATAEMFLLFTFVAFGASLIWSGVVVADVRTLAFAVVALGARTVVLLPVLRRAGIGRRSAWLIAWFGPRGLSSLLLILLPVFAGVQGAEYLFAVTCLVVLLSVVVHGTAIAVFLRRPPFEPAADAGFAPASAAPTAPAPSTTSHQAAPTTPEAAASEAPITSATATPQTAPAASHASTSVARVPDRITLDELRRLWDENQPVILADARTDRTYASDGIRARGAIRLPPDDAVRDARRLKLSQHATLVLYCA